MEEGEPVEHAQEQIHEHAHGTRERWVMGVALTAAVLAALAAVAASLSGHHESECVLDQIKASDQWSYYQAKGIKEISVATKCDILEAMGKPAPERGEVERYRKEKEQIKEKAEELTHESERHMREHVTYSRAVTMSQIAIAVAAISVLSKRPLFWFLSVGFGLVGLFFMVRGLMG